MRFIGAHVSASGGVENAPLNAKKIGANAFALFVKNQRQWNAKPLTSENIKYFKKNCELANIKSEHILPHNSYLINLGHYDDEKRQQSINAFIDEIQRVNELGLKMINFHPGSHLNALSESECLYLIVKSLDEILDKTQNVKLVIENTAGQGSNLGYKFEHLAYIIESVSDKNRIGICIDTCHAFAAGYDLRSKQAYKNSMQEFDAVVGYEYLCGMHLNDAKHELGSKKDRHESIGKGYLGIDAFKNIINDENIGQIPLVLETIDESIWDKEIEILRNLKETNV
ncbi:deoxyribonuclease IV [Campylobacter majalis]|uniref:deoxyribonuclease IV n=1 Tax=Campylobacter majalis TaxID=2790656 RepID=UPI003D68560F